MTEEIDAKKTLGLAMKSIASAFAVSLPLVGGKQHLVPQAITEAITEQRQNEELLVLLSKLSGLPIPDIITKVQAHPWPLGMMADYYREYGAFPDD
ncbi:MAG: hypothetical protein ACYTFW_03715 [Planctomycetota bacterium]|jgi:hypothetical protein